MCSLHPSNDYKTVGLEIFCSLRELRVPIVCPVWFIAGDCTGNLQSVRVTLTSCGVSNETRQLTVPSPSGNTKCTRKGCGSFIQAFDLNKIDSFIFRAFQQAVVRNLNDKNTQLQKELDNVIREGGVTLARQPPFLM